MKDEIYREQRLIKQAQMAVDRALRTIRIRKLYGREAWQLFEEAREKVLELFPDKEETFELIYWPRFSRAIWENMLRDLEPVDIEI